MEQSQSHSELMALIKAEVDKATPSVFYKELFKNKNQAIIAIFRSLPTITRQLIVRRVYLGQASLDFYSSQCPEAKSHFLALQTLGLCQLKPSQKHIGIEEVILQSEFSDGVKEIVDGRSQACFEEVAFVKEPSVVEIDVWKRECQSKWKRLFNVISQPDKTDGLEYGSRIKLTLKNSKLLQRDSDIGFQFILTSTRQQINMLVTHYTRQMISTVKPPAHIGVIRFILQLSVLDPHRLYLCNNLEPLQADILDDFHQLGFISREGNQLRVTYLLWNFLYEQPQVSIDIRCNIIVEANFRVYAYLESRDQMEESILYNLLKLFSEVKYRFPNLIIADLNLNSVANAYRRNLKASQIIQFFEMNNKTPRAAKVEAELTDKQKIKEASQQDIRKRLSFLRVFQEDNATLTSILPHNIVQQLTFWEQETKSKP